MSMITMLVAASLQFAGGSVNDLCDSFQAEHRNIAISRTRDLWDLKPFVVDLKGLDSINDGMKLGAKLSIVPGAELTFSDGYLPKSRVANAFSDDAEVMSLKGDALQNGLVTFKSSGKGALEVKSLSDMKWSKPLTVHWFYEDLRCFCNFEQVPEARFLQMVARSVGATFRENPRGYFLELNPSEAQRRAYATMSSPPPPYVRMSASGMAKRKLTASAIASLTYDQVAYLLSKPGQSLQLPLTQGTAVYQDALAYRQALASAQQEAAPAQSVQIQIGGQSGESVVRVLPAAPQQARPGLVITTDFQVTLNGR